MARKFKNFLTAENDRNMAAHRVILRFMEKALEAKPQMLIGHHLIYMLPGEQPTEIPSIDTLMFSHDLMKAVFGEDQYLMVIQTLAQRDVDTRDIVLNDMLDMLEGQQKTAATG